LVVGGGWSLFEKTLLHPAPALQSAAVIGSRSAQQQRQQHNTAQQHKQPRDRQGQQQHAQQASKNT